MNFNEYSKEANKTDKVAGEPGWSLYQFIYGVLALAGEAGELANKAKKIMRNDNNTGTYSPNEEEIFMMTNELGDILWYMNKVVVELNKASNKELSLDRIALENLAKLHAREVKGMVKGSGDNR